MRVITHLNEFPAALFFFFFFIRQMKLSDTNTLSFRGNPWTPDSLSQHGGGQTCGNLPSREKKGIRLDVFAAIGERLFSHISQQSSRVAVLSWGFLKGD